MLSTSSLGRCRFVPGDEAPVLATSSCNRRRFGLGVEATGVEASSCSRRRFGLGVEAPALSTSWLAVREADFDDDEDAGERSPDPPLDRREVVLRIFSRLLASRSARDSHGTMNGENVHPECLPWHSPGRPRPPQLISNCVELSVYVLNI